MVGTTADEQASQTTTATEPAASSLQPPISNTRRAPEIFLRLITTIHSVLPGFVRSRLPVTFIGYAIINGSAFFLDVGCLWVIETHLHWWHPVSISVGYAIAGVYSFLLNRWLNFQSHGHLVNQGSRYAIGLISQFLVFVQGLTQLLSWLGINLFLARLISACCEAAYLYVFIRLWVFRSTPESQKAAVPSDSPVGA